MAFANIVRYVYRERNDNLKHILTSTDSNFLSSMFSYDKKKKYLTARRRKKAQIGSNQKPSKFLFIRFFESTVIIKAYKSKQHSCTFLCYKNPLYLDFLSRSSLVGSVKTSQTIISVFENVKCFFSPLMYA